MDVQWWQEWQLRILVLSSLFLQYFLFMSSFLRKRSVPSWVRFFIWLAYVGSDAIALYALAALFNHPRGIPLGVKVLWAPILLVHLGGQDVITAYNIEDNELWKRHALTAMSQVTVAVYVFWKSWSVDKWSGQQLAAAILLFIPGILKCILKPWDLKRVSINSLVDSSGSEKKNGGINSAESTDENSEINSLEDFIQAANNHFLGQSSGADHQPNEELNKKPYDLFIDLAFPYSYRLNFLKHLEQNPSSVDWLLRSGLSSAFDLLYTKESVNQHSNNSRSLWDYFIDLIRVVAACCIVAVGVLIPLKQGMDIHTDVRITYILLYCTAALEYLTFVVIFNRINQRGDQQQWPGHVSQYNLIWYLARNKKYNKLRKLATILVCKDYIDQLWCMKPSKSSSNITNQVYIYLKAGWTERHIRDMATYRAFNDNRGHWTLKKENCRNLEWSLQRPFHESVILWHLATDFCLHNLITVPSSPESCQALFRSKEISNYMVYLLFVNPEMLMIGTRRSLFREAYQQLKETLKIDIRHVDGAGILRQDSWEESEIARMISFNINNEENRDNFKIVHDAWRLAKELSDYRIHKDDKKMWSVVQGVWVEMLCFSAGRCRGYLHAKSLGQGGEYLSYIWLLLSYMGMETLGERLQRTNLQEEANDVASVTTAEATSTDDTAIARAADPGGHGDGPTAASTLIATGGEDVLLTPSASSSPGRREGAAQRRLNRLLSSPPVTTAGRP